MTRKWSFAVCLALIAFGAQASQEKAVFSSYTEESTAGWAHASEALAAKLVHERQAKDEVEQCISDKRLAKNYRQFFATKSIPLSTAKARFLFVRAASQPYCQTFFGAHIYSFWITDQRQRVVFSSSADAFDVLSSGHGGMRDLLVSQCRGGYCYRTTFVFEKHAYREQSCVIDKIDSEESVSGCKP